MFGEAKVQTEIDGEKEMLETSIVQAMGKNKYGNLVETELKEKLNNNLGKTEENGVKITAENNNFFVTFPDSNRTYLVDEDGNSRKIDWIKTTDKNGNNILTNGKTMLTIGDYIIYDPNSNGEHTYTAETDKTGVSGEGQTFSTANTPTSWRVLGIEYETDGDYLVIIPSSPIQSTLQSDLALRGGTGYQYGVEEIKNICKIYGNGQGAASSRAMEIEDVNKITGYNPLKTGDGTVFRKGKLFEYNSSFTVKDIYPYNITYTNGTTWQWGYSSFLYWSENNKIENARDTKTATLVSSFYEYYPTTLTENATGETKGISSSSKEYSMLFRNKKYLLASVYANGGGESTNMSNMFINGLFCIQNNAVSPGANPYAPSSYNNYLFYAGNPNCTQSGALMPIVYLKSDIILESTGNIIDGCNEWKIN